MAEIGIFSSSEERLEMLEEAVATRGPPPPRSGVRRLNAPSVHAEAGHEPPSVELDRERLGSPSSGR